MRRIRVGNTRSYLERSLLLDVIVITNTVIQLNFAECPETELVALFGIRSQFDGGRRRHIDDGGGNKTVTVSLTRQF